MAPKSQYLQIRVSPAEKEKLKRLARSAGQDLSAYVLARALPSGRIRFEHLVRSLGESGGDRYVLAELNDFLSGLAPLELPEAVMDVDTERLTPYLANYLAAMVEQASYRAGVHAPAWAHRVPPLERPHFAAPLMSLRLHLLRASPVPFKKRNLFVDSALGARV
jgi:hypothetical protein